MSIDFGGNWTDLDSCLSADKTINVNGDSEGVEIRSSMCLKVDADLICGETSPAGKL